MIAHETVRAAAPATAIDHRLQGYKEGEAVGVALIDGLTRVAVGGDVVNDPLSTRCEGVWSCRQLRSLEFTIQGLTVIYSGKLQTQFLPRTSVSWYFFT